MKEMFPSLQPVDISGERGRAGVYLQDEQKYEVNTFSGLLVLVPEDKLSAFEPPDSEEPGGFCVAWPTRLDDTSLASFASDVAGKVSDQGFCVVQMFEGEEAVVETLDTCREILNWGSLQSDVEEEYLGSEPVEGKVAWMQYQLSREDGKQPGMKTVPLESLVPSMNIDGMGALERVDKSITNVAALLWSSVQEWEDEKAFTPWGRTNPLVRASFEADDTRSVLRRNTLGMDDAEELDEFVSFVDSRKLCALYLVENDGGELELNPKAEAYDYSPVTIPLSKNKLVIFRCDQLGLNFSYKPEGRSLCLQSWILDMPSKMRESEEVLRFIDGPEEPLGQRNCVMGMMTRYPGNGSDPLAFWSMLQTGGDTQVEVPATRWDIDIYYRKEHTLGFSMTCHGGLLMEKEVSGFDNVFFGIPAEQAKCMAPYHRILMEVGYEALARAGHRKHEMLGWKCGVFVGDSGTDWDGPQMTAENLHWRWEGRERSAAATRLSHVLGLKGPTLTAETACSSSLVAAGMAQASMRQPLPGQKAVGVASGLMDGLVIGINTCIGPIAYITLSGPGMLTSRGRCFTFDSSADGFARGEGVGALKLKICNNSYESMGRLAVLIGCSVNQDGRSASMTAPHGPSQQAVIRDSMREGGISPKMITIAECHGTGTALGDPIEVGALRGVLGNRASPLLATSSKSNLGHLEAGAGMAGLIKCICMLQFCSGSPNIHLVKLNAHLDVEGFPCYFESEAVDFGINSGLSGVSSFGFGGTNARADVWGHATHGHKIAMTGHSANPPQIMV